MSTELAELHKVVAELHAKGRILRKLDAEGNPMTRMSSVGVPEQVWVLDEYATPAELEYWRSHIH